MTTVDTEEYTYTYTISENTIYNNNIEVISEQVGSADAYIETTISNTSYDVTNFFLTGEETGDKTFDEVWAEGNSVTFMLAKTKYEEIYYEGTTAPSTAPTVSNSTAIGSSSGGTSGTDAWSWDIDETISSGNVTLTNLGDSMTYSYLLYYSFRGLE